MNTKSDKCATEHSNKEEHHHHSHSNSSRHDFGHHLFQLDNVSVKLQRAVFSKGAIFAKNVKTPVLNHCSLSLHSGEIVFVIGESGSGKTMLINLLTGNLPENSIILGNVYLQGNKLALDELKHNAINNISFIPQSTASLNPLNKYELDGALMYPHEMSGGMKRCVLINDSYKKHSKIIVADEPTEGLDNKSKNVVINNLIKNKNKDMCLLVITHDLDLALKHADRIAIFQCGTILEETSSKNFLSGNLHSDYAKKMFYCYKKDKRFTTCDFHSKKSINLIDLSVEIEGKKIFNSLNLTFEAKTINCLFGDVGIGKSTLCKCISGWTKLTSGIIKTNFQLTNCASGARTIQLVPQNPFFSFDEKVTIKKSLEEAGEIDENKLFELKLEKTLLNRRPTELSGGEIQRFCIIRALMTKPDFLILDEATSMVDIVVEDTIVNMLIKHHLKENMGIIFATHNKKLANCFGERIINLNEVQNLSS